MNLEEIRQSMPTPNTDEKNATYLSHAVSGVVLRLAVALTSAPTTTPVPRTTAALGIVSLADRRRSGAQS